MESEQLNDSIAEEQPATPAPIIIDFENLTPGGPGGGGGSPHLVTDDYDRLGVLFNGVFAFDYSKGLLAIPRFAHSGTKAVEQCVAQEFCSEPIEIRFTVAQNYVKVWTGYSQPLAAPRTVVLRAFDRQGGQVGQATATFPQSNAPQPIQTPLEVRTSNATITRVLVSFLPETTFTNGLAVDDVEFDRAGRKPPCTSRNAPVVTLGLPIDGARVQLNEFLLQAIIRAESPLEAATVTAATPVAKSTLDLLSGGIVSRAGGSFGPIRIDELLSPGLNTLTLAASDCKGSGDSSVAITYAPIASDTHFVFLGLDILQDGQWVPPDTPLIARRPTTVRVYACVRGSTSEITDVTGTLEARLPAFPQSKPSDLQNPLPPGSLPSLNSITVNSSPDVVAKRLDINATLNFELPIEWVPVGFVHYSLVRLNIEGNESALPCDGCSNLDSQGNPVFYWFRDLWPILETDYINPDYDTSSPTWSGDLVGNSTVKGDNAHKAAIFSAALFDSPDPQPPFEWTPILSEEEIDRQIVGVSGSALLFDRGHGPGISGDDIPFTHPFGFDWEFFIALDPPFWRLLAPSNTGTGPHGDGEYLEATNTAFERGVLQTGVGVLGVETDQQLVPPDWRLQDKDRVAVFGRWIVDAGHEDFHTEIHPPLLLAYARPCPSIGEATCSWVISRPYFVSQWFGDGGIGKHMGREMLKAFGYGCDWYYFHQPCTTRFEAHPPIRNKPFAGTQQMHYIVRPPSPRQSATDILRVSFHFTVRNGVSVRVSAADSDGVRVTIWMNEDEYDPPGLQRRDRNWSKEELEALSSDFDDLFNYMSYAGFALAGPLHVAYFWWVVSNGILSDQYAPPQARSTSDQDNAVLNVRAEDLGESTPFAVGSDQPFPIYGWLNVEWER